MSYSNWLVDIRIKMIVKIKILIKKGNFIGIISKRVIVIVNLYQWEGIQQNKYKIPFQSILVPMKFLR